jgi:hypothetical protein
MRFTALSVPVSNTSFNFCEEIDALFVSEMSQVADKISDRVFIARTRKLLECPQRLLGEFDMLFRIHRFAALVDRLTGFFTLSLGRKYDDLYCVGEYWRQRSNISQIYRINFELGRQKVGAISSKVSVLDISVGRVGPSN